MKRLLLVPALSAVLGLPMWGADTDSPSGNRTTPTTIASISPRGVARGTTVEMTVEGFNLAKAKRIIFSEPGIKGRILRVKELPDVAEVRLGSAGTQSTIDLGPLPPRNQVTVEVDVSADAHIGPVSFRLENDLGTSPEGRILIEPYYGEIADAEPNDNSDNATEVYLPAILTGTISKAGDQDLFKIKVKAGDEIVFENSSAMVGSTLQPVVAILTEDQTVLKEYGTDGGRSASVFAHKFDKAGSYYVRVTDYEESGRATHTYRIKVGNFPYAVSAYPLGVPRGKAAAVTVNGPYLTAGKIEVKGQPNTPDPDFVTLRPKGKSGLSFSEVKLALGDEPEIDSAGGNTSVAAAQPITLPVTINGKVGTANGKGAESYFRFNARKGQKIVLEVNARRLGSELDSFLEVLDAKGNSIERSVIRPVWETITTLRDVDSVSRGMRLQAWNTVNIGDYMMIGSEVVRVDQLPRGPDDDMLFENFMGQRVAFFDTSAEAHAIDKAIYKVQLLPPGAQPPANGLPLMRLYYRNDDGGPSYGKDSVVHFTAPADGQYIARLRDVRYMGGDDYAYRLTVREPKPDFRLSVNPRNPNVPVGGTVPVTVTVQRLDEFEGPIDIEITGLPAGLKATKGVVNAGQISTVLLITAESNASLGAAASWKLEGKARVGNQVIAHQANPDDTLMLVSLMPRPDIGMVSETREVVLEPGKSAEIKVRIQRNNEFGGRVPVEVRNLPPRVRVMDVGLNGVLINETETERTFMIEALPNAEPVEQMIYVSGLIETRSPQQNSFAADQPIRLKVKPKVEVSSLKD